jgi:hypothetical protein
MIIALIVLAIVAVLLPLIIYREATKKKAERVDSLVARAFPEGGQTAEAVRDALLRKKISRRSE